MTHTAPTDRSASTVNNPTMRTESDPGFMPTEPGTWQVWRRYHGWREVEVFAHDGDLCILVDGKRESTSDHRWNGRAFT